MALRRIYLEIDTGEEKQLNVGLDVYASYGNLGIGSYEYWGAPGNDVQMGWEIEGWEYDKMHYTKQQIELIDKYIDDNFDDICNHFFKIVEND